MLQCVDTAYCWRGRPGDVYVSSVRGVTAEQPWPDQAHSLTQPRNAGVDVQRLHDLRQNPQLSELTRQTYARPLRSATSPHVLQSLK